MPDKSAHFLHMQKKKKAQNTTAQRGVWVVESESKNIQQGPKPGIKPGTIWTYPGLRVIPPSIQPSHTLPPGALVPGVCAHACVCIYVRTCMLVTTEVLYSPVQSHALPFRCALSILPLIPFNENASAGLDFRPRLSPCALFLTPRPVNDALYTPYLNVRTTFLCREKQNWRAVWFCCQHN